MVAEPFDGWNPRRFRLFAETGRWAYQDERLHAYADFCRLMDEGRRGEAMDAIRRFVTSTDRWSVEDRRRFVDRVLEAGSRAGDNRSLVPHPLLEGLVRPVLREWCQSDPGAGTPFRWLGMIEHDHTLLQRAIENDPGDMIALRALLGSFDQWLHYSLHELPYGYIGELEEDRDSVRQGLAFAVHVTDGDERERWRWRFQEHHELLESYAAYRVTDRSVPFEAWARAHGRPSSERGWRLNEG